MIKTLDRMITTIEDTYKKVKEVEGLFEEMKKIIDGDGQGDGKIES